MATSSQVAALTNYDAGTIERDPILYKPKIAIIPVTYEKVAGNTDGDKILLWRVHCDWSVLSIKFNNDALTGATDVNVGLWSDAAVASATDVDENVYADAISFGSALAWAEQAFEARDLSKLGQYVWQDAGASARPDPGIWYRIGLNLVTGGTAAGTISGLLTVALPS